MGGTGLGLNCPPGTGGESHRPPSKRNLALSAFKALYAQQRNALECAGSEVCESRTPPQKHIRAIIAI